MELIFEQAKLETNKEREHMKGIEKKVVVAYENIPNTAQMVKLTTKTKIDHIV
jgi:hypothetical protein